MESDIIEMEHCISCGVSTPYEKSQHVDMRMGYIEGAGQLCVDCHQKLHGHTNVEPDEIFR